MFKTITATAAALLASVALATPAQAAQPADLSDVKYMLSLAVTTWYQMDYDTQDSICTWYYLDPAGVRKEMAQGWYDDVFEGEYSMYDTKRAVNRLLNKVC